VRREQFLCDYETVILFLGNIYIFPPKSVDLKKKLFSASTNTRISKLFHLRRQGKYDVRSSWALAKEEKGIGGSKKKGDKFRNKR